jgi:hypothetical protein
MINDSKTHLAISEKNPFLMVNFMYFFLGTFSKWEKEKINHLMKFQILMMENVMMSFNLSQ